MTEWRQVTKDDVGEKIEITDSSYNPNTITAVGKYRYLSIGDKQGGYENLWSIKNNLVRPYVEPLNVNVGDYLFAEKRNQTPTDNCWLVIGKVAEVTDVSINILREGTKQIKYCPISQWTFRKIKTETE